MELAYLLGHSVLGLAGSLLAGRAIRRARFSISLWESLAMALGALPYSLRTSIWSLWAFEEFNVSGQTSMMWRAIWAASPLLSFALGCLYGVICALLRLALRQRPRGE